MLTTAILRTFARMDTTKQVATLKRVGIETECADALLGHLAGKYPDRYSALTTALARLDNLSSGHAWQMAGAA